GFREILLVMMTVIVQTNYVSADTAETNHDNSLKVHGRKILLVMMTAFDTLELSSACSLILGKDDINGEFFDSVSGKTVIAEGDKDDVDGWFWTLKQDFVKKF
ncbi:hypothetical protein M8C21_027044, partial [Ambrosia artemisiifolia]